MRERKADILAHDLLRRIVGGEYPEGSILPRETELAARYRVNRSVVREAVKKLEVHRLVRPVRRRGTVVLDPLASLSPAVLREMLSPAGRRVDRAMLQNLLEVRRGIDLEMNAAAAERRSADDLRRLDKCVRALEDRMAAPREYARAVEDLVLAIARATKNPIYEMLVHWHAEVTRDIEDLLLLVRFPSEAHVRGAGHLVEAIRARDAETARALTAAFHEWAIPQLLEAAAGGPAAKTQRQPPKREAKTTP